MSRQPPANMPPHITTTIRAMAATATAEPPIISYLLRSKRLLRVGRVSMPVVLADRHLDGHEADDQSNRDGELAAVGIGGHAV
jgi:hypothetical protein